MTNHEWYEKDEETGERRYFRASKFAKRWTIITTLKSAPDWEEYNPVPLWVLEELRKQLMNKYQRRRIPYEDVVAIDKMVLEAGGVSLIVDATK